MFTRRIWFFSWALAALKAQTRTWITHGPMLGRPGPTTMGVWARTSKAASFTVRYGLSPGELSMVSPVVPTRAENDNTGWILLRDLRPNTTYYYVALSVDEAFPNSA